MNIFIIGSGTFGTAIANELVRNINNKVTIFSRSEEKKNEINNFRIGDEIPNFHIKPISRSMLNLYATASGDHNPIHIDSDYAKKSGLPDVIAHGMLVMSFIGQAMTNNFPQETIKKANALIEAAKDSYRYR
mgnify:CR=1 FL=1